MGDWEFFADLALGFMRNTLTEEKKREVQGLVMDCPEFREMLRWEIALQKGLKCLKRETPVEVKTRVYRRLLGTERRFTYFKVLESVLEATLPFAFCPVLKLLERGVFVHE